MEYRITDLMDAVSDDSVELEAATLASTEKIKELTMKKIQENGIKRSARPVRLRRIIVLAAAAALLLALGMTAYATGLFGWRIHPVETDETVIVSTEIGDRDLTGTTDLILYDESSGTRYRAEFRPGWLPEEPELWLPEQGTDFRCDFWGDHVEEGWYQHYSCDLRTNGTEEAYQKANIFGIPYQIEMISSYPAKKLLLMSKETRSMTEEDWDGVRVLKVETVMHTWPMNYVILMNEDEGWAVSVGGEDSIETLEHIARELEVRVTDVEVELEDSDSWTYFTVGRG